MTLIEEIFERNPVIPAIKDKETFKSALISSNEIVFIISSSLTEIENMVNELKAKNKIVFIHIDMIEGLSNSNYVVDYVVSRIKPDGIITTRQNIAIHASKLNVAVIRRFFVLDSYSLEKSISLVREGKYVAVEILPGLMPKIIKRLSKAISYPIITGGLIEDKEDIIHALNSGAVAISTTSIKLWDI